MLRHQAVAEPYLAGSQTVISSDPVGPDGDRLITGDLALMLRAERTTAPSERNLNGRVYTITVECTDGTSSAVKTTTVRVPLNQGK